MLWGNALVAVLSLQFLPIMLLGWLTITAGVAETSRALKTQL
jgi:hypothetical protein